MAMPRPDRESNKPRTNPADVEIARSAAEQVTALQHLEHTIHCRALKTADAAHAVIDDLLRALDDAEREVTDLRAALLGSREGGLER